MCHVAQFTIISAENLIAPLPPSAAEALFNYFSVYKQNLGYSEKIVFSAFLWTHTMFFSLHFFIGKTFMFEHRNLSKILFCHVLLDFEKSLKIDHFERGISEHFPIAYDGIRMKLLNLELLISKALTLSYAFFQFLCFHCCPGFGPWPLFL